MYLDSKEGYPKDIVFYSVLTSAFRVGVSDVSVPKTGHV